MQRLLAQLSINHEFFDAIDASNGQHIKVSRYDERLAKLMFGRDLTPAEVGCFASHFLLWQRCADSAEPLIIMEDDVDILPEFSRSLDVTASVIRSLQIARLCVRTNRRFKKVATLSGGFELIRYFKGPRGTQCYALSPEGARRLVRFSDVWTEAVDMYLDAFWRHGVPCWAIQPFHVRHSDETIPSDIGLRTRGRLPSLAKARRELTRAGQTIMRIAFNAAQLIEDRRISADLIRTARY